MLACYLLRCDLVSHASCFTTVFVTMQRLILGLLSSMNDESYNNATQGSATEDTFGATFLDSMLLT